MHSNIDEISEAYSSNESISFELPVIVIVPPVVCHNLDPHTGIPFMPHMAAHLAGSLKHSGKESSSH